MEENELVIGAAGHYIAAVLETAGFYTHGQILDNFTGLITTAGGFIFTWYVMGGIISIALFGNYKKAFYFLIGPGLFYFMLTNTTNVSAVQHPFGSAIHDAGGQRVMEALRESEALGFASDGEAEQLTRYGDSARVATFVVMWDNLISSIVQGLVGFIVNTENSEYLIGTMRERVIKRVAKIRVEDQKYIKLTSMLTFGQCADQMWVNYRLGNPPLSNAAPGSAEEFMKEDLQEYYDQEKLKTFHFPDDVRGYVSDMLNVNPGENITCDEVWDFVKEITIIVAQQQLTVQPDEQADHPEVDWQQVYDDVCDKLNEEDADDNDTQRCVQVLAAFMLRNTMAYTPHHAMVTQMAGREDWHRFAMQQGFGDFQSRVGAAERLKIIWLAGFMPYLQGVLLYVLACAFPFFTLFLLVPSRVTSFFVWMSLWLWVKSWDVGFAFVHFTRQVFWKLMPHSENINAAVRSSSNYDEINWDVEASVFNVMFNSDPTFHHNTYYMIIGLFTLAVPLVTAHLCLGATNLWDALKMGVDQSAQVLQADHEKKGRAALADAYHARLANEQMMARGYGAQAGNLKGRSAAIKGGDGSAVDRRFDGGQALARYSRGEAAEALFRHSHYDKGVMRLIGTVGAHAGRRDPRSRHLAAGAIDANLNKLREKFEVTGNMTDMARTGSNAWLTALGTSRNDSSKISSMSFNTGGGPGGGEEGDGE